MRTTVDLDEELLERALEAAGPGATKTGAIEEGLRLLRERFEARKLEEERTRLALQALRETERDDSWVSDDEVAGFFDSWERSPGTRRG